ncbi:hypothetical protein Hte_000276 [Hypoxylon texense]
MDHVEGKLMEGYTGCSTCTSPFKCLCCVCSCGNNVHECPERGHSHPYNPLHIVYYDQGMVHDMTADRLVPLVNTRFGPHFRALYPCERNRDHGHSHSHRRDHGHDHRHNHSHGHGHESSRSRSTHVHSQNSTHGNAHGNHRRLCYEHAQAQGHHCHHDRPARRPTDTHSPRRRRTAGSSRAATNDTYPRCERHMRERYGPDWASRSPTFYQTAADGRATDAGVVVRVGSPEPHDYELDDLRERYHSDGGERSDPELDRNSNGSPPPPYSP